MTVAAGAKRVLAGMTVTTPCFWCGTKLDRHNRSIDHLVPRSLGGNSKPENLVLSCKFCNGRRGDMAAGLFKEVMRGAVPLSEARALTERSVRANSPAHGRQRAEDRFKAAEALATRFYLGANGRLRGTPIASLLDPSRIEALRGSGLLAEISDTE